MDRQKQVTETLSERRKVSVGIIMTILYSIIYIGFVALSIFLPGVMGVRAIFGLNLAVAYGLGLIIAAVIFALVYNQLCKNSRPEKS